jgi:nucleoside-diphosphate-sugar epimerase
MKRVLLTGATGFIGLRAATVLRERGYEVHAVGRTPPRDENIEFHRCNILDVGTVCARVAEVRASHLLHLAWDVTPGRYWAAAENLDWVSASLHLVRAFAAAGGNRAVFAGTCAEYQWGAPRFLETETPCVPATLYGASKDALRRLVEAYGATAGLSIGWGRIFYPFGPGEKSGRLVSDAIESLLRGKPFLASHGYQQRDYLHVEDVAGAFAAFVDSDVRGAVNIGSGRAVPVRVILELIGQETGVGALIRFGERHLSATEPDVIEADITRLSNEIGFRPRHDLAGGVADAIAWWRRRQTHDTPQKEAP